MTPVSNHTHQQMPLPPAENNDTERTPQPAERKTKAESFFFPSGVLKEVDNPAHWDEAWFASYE